MVVATNGRDGSQSQQTQYRIASPLAQVHRLALSHSRSFCVKRRIFPRSGSNSSDCCVCFNSRWIAFPSCFWWLVACRSKNGFFFTLTCFPRSPRFFGVVFFNAIAQKMSVFGSGRYRLFRFARPPSNGQDEIGKLGPPLIFVLFPESVYTVLIA